MRPQDPTEGWEAGAKRGRARGPSRGSRRPGGPTLSWQREHCQSGIDSGELACFCNKKVKVLLPRTTLISEFPAGGGTEPPAALPCLAAKAE